VIEHAREQTKDNAQIEWLTRNVADAESKQLAIAYKIKFVPTTIINGEKWLIGVTSVVQILEEIAKFK
jgi:protein-disulfide isomerase